MWGVTGHDAVGLEGDIVVLLFDGIDCAVHHFNAMVGGIRDDLPFFIVSIVGEIDFGVAWGEVIA